MASLFWLLVAALSVLSNAAVTIFPQKEAPAWMMKFQMVLSLAAADGEANPLSFSVYPLTQSVGLNGSDPEKNAISIRGAMIKAEPVNFDRLNNSDSIAYLCCDPSNSSDTMNDMMTIKSAAILLYSMSGDCCGLEGSDFPYKSIFTMANSEEAIAALKVNDDAKGSPLRATIAGNATDAKPVEETQSGNNSAVAMSILYSITGLITLLFLAIIGTGAIRAHRYPERYGPRSGYGGGPRQSRAKGLARAVLETLPIVKFGDTLPAKPDPDLELEHQPSRSSHDPATGTRLSAIPEESQTPRRQSHAAPIAGAELQRSGALTASQGANLAKIDESDSHSQDDEHLGCSICTEDFTVGEDVRVLPCDHKFHPPCIDPWLINVSGTCPLCRLDLRPQGEDTAATGFENLGELAPPLAAEWNEQDDSTAGATPTQRRRASRFLDLHRLRHASVEERIEILRRHRSQQQPASAGSQPDHEERGRRARLADRLRDKFHIRTRAQSPRQTRPIEEAQQVERSS
ncbi:hypothetical protein B0H63DRAFT_163293 [Podospora didyma]|uniref:RING-type E3 ubiquitin transferase n=1 Tax=Podospora didyma TaxID=330526 RepID=A0AAE0NTY6_9PEZI|nr:hypothetical protein B0H63DRAFT_163293 [Podospora didyma]